MYDCHAWTYINLKFLGIWVTFVKRIVSRRKKKKKVSKKKKKRSEKKKKLKKQKVKVFFSYRRQGAEVVLAVALLVSLHDATFSRAPPRHRLDRLVALTAAPQPARDGDVLVFAVALAEDQVDGKLPLLLHERQPDQVRRDGRRAEPLHAVIVEEPVLAQRRHRAVDRFNRSRVNVPEKRETTSQQKKKCREDVFFFSLSLSIPDCSEEKKARN